MACFKYCIIKVLHGTKYEGHRWHCFGIGGVPLLSPSTLIKMKVVGGFRKVEPEHVAPPAPPTFLFTTDFIMPWLFCHKGVQRQRVAPRDLWPALFSNISRGSTVGVHDKPVIWGILLPVLQPADYRSC